MIYEKSVIPIIESKYTLFTATEKKIADYFLQCDPSMDINIQNVAERLYVSQASISRFAKKCGFVGFREFIFAFLDSVRVKKPNANMITQNVFNTYQDLLNKAYSILDNDQIQRVVMMLVNSKKVIAVGKGSSGYAASEMESRFVRVGLDIDSLTDSDRIRMQSVFLKDGDTVVAFSISGKTEDILFLLKSAHDRGKKTIFFTSADSQSLHEFCDEVVVVASLEYLENGNLISPQFPMLLVLDLVYSEYINIDSVIKSAILEDTVTTLNKKEDDRRFYLSRPDRFR